MTTGCRVAVMKRSLICAFTSVSPATCEAHSGGLAARVGPAAQHSGCAAPGRQAARRHASGRAGKQGAGRRVRRRLQGQRSPWGRE